MSSLSMTKVRGCALNANTQNTNNFSMWMEPLSHKDYPVTYIANPINNAVITSNGVKNVAIAQPGLLYNRVLRLDISGSVNLTRWTTGQTINTVFLDAADPSLNHINATITNGTIASFSYVPVSNNSKIIVEYSAYYEITGNASGGGDTAVSNIIVDDTNIIAKRVQKYLEVVGGGTRGSTIFPICGAIVNTQLTARKIDIQLVSSSDSISFYKGAFDACLKVTENRIISVLYIFIIVYCNVSNLSHG